MNQTVKANTRLIIFVIDFFSFIILVFTTLFLLKAFIPSLNDFIIKYNRLVSFLLFFFYYFFLESIFSRTVGKFFTKTKVIDTLTLSKPSFLKVFIRTISRFIPLEVFYIFMNENNLTLHDLLSKTTVIYSKNLKT